MWKERVEKERQTGKGGKESIIWFCHQFHIKIFVFTIYSIMLFEEDDSSEVEMWRYSGHLEVMFVREIAKIEELRNGRKVDQVKLNY